VALDITSVAVGLLVLAWASDRFVVSAARLATALRVSPLIIGTVLVGFGTSAPELLVSSIAAGQGEIEIGIGNVVGSNLANLTLVLGGAALVAPAEVVPGVLRREAPISLAAVLLFALVVQDGLTAPEGVALLVAMVAAVIVLIRSTTHGPPSERADAREELEHEIEELEERHDESPVAAGRELVGALIGLVGTVLGAQLLVAGARGVADEVGLSGGFVGLTLVAVGTSLPELVTGVQSMRRRESSLLIGNVLGSNMFNSVGVGGAMALVGPAAVTDASLTVVAVVVMVGVVALATVFLRGGFVHRWQAVLLLVVYFATLPLMA
jgi:cation:H+ antiporter